MNGRYILDTNIVIALFAAEESVVQNVKQAELIMIPSIVIGELYYGAYNSKLVSENILKIQEFTQSVIVAQCDSETGRYYGQIKTELKRNGTPIPENDIWIASLGIQNHATLITRDKHFNNISNLEVGIW